MSHEGKMRRGSILEGLKDLTPNQKDDLKYFKKNSKVKEVESVLDPAEQKPKEVKDKDNKFFGKKKND